MRFRVTICSRFRSSRELHSILFDDHSIDSTIVHRDDDTLFHFSLSLESFHPSNSSRNFSNYRIYSLVPKNALKLFRSTLKFLFSSSFYTRRVRSYRRSFDNALPRTRYVLYTYASESRGLIFDKANENETKGKGKKRETCVKLYIKSQSRVIQRFD